MTEYEKLEDKRRREREEKRGKLERLREYFYGRMDAVGDKVSMDKKIEEISELVLDREMELRLESVVQGKLEEIEGRLSELARMGDVESMLRYCGPVSVLQMVEIMKNSKNERVKLDVAKTLAYMAGYKPVERSMSLKGNVNLMNEKEVDKYLESNMRELDMLKKEMGLIEEVKAVAGAEAVAKEEDEEIIN